MTYLNRLKNPYANSLSHLDRAQLTIPLGSQTFSKSRTQYPVGVSPLYLERGSGAEVWDVDGNKYIDLVSSLACITLGYGDRAVNRAVSKQLKLGVSLSLPARLEAEVSELIVELVPSAEMVRFGKNGSDATSAAIRLARAFTGREHILVCGYHGWHDWFIGTTTRNKGVPESISLLTHKFEYNNIESLRSLLDSIPGQVAAVIMEPMNSQYPEDDFLKKVLELTHQAGALLIFDETITGFRFSRGGAQELFGVTPDLSTFGKGIANGFPLSAVVGRREIMMEMEEIFFSGTFGGELLSLTAAKVVLTRHLEDDICGKLSLIGDNLSEALSTATASHGLDTVLGLSGHPTWRFLNWESVGDYFIEELQTYFMQKVFEKGLLVLGTHNVSLAHSHQVVKRVAGIYDSVAGELSKAIENETLRNELLVKPLKPLFQVR